MKDRAGGGHDRTVEADRLDLRQSSPSPRCP
jgi:hypothetical protein